MTNIFLSNDGMFTMASNLDADGRVEYLDGLVEMGVFADADVADAAFAEAVAARRAEMVRKAQDAAMTEMKEAWDAFTMPKSLINKLTAIGEMALKAEMTATVGIFIKHDPETGEMVITSRVVDGRIKSSGKRRKGASGKVAYLDGEKVNAAMLKGKLKDTYAGRIYADAHAGDPERYGPKTNLNATQAVKADADLKDRIEWRDA